jgi:hypothetical protein
LLCISPTSQAVATEPVFLLTGFGTISFGRRAEQSLINGFHITGIQNMHAHQNWDLKLRVINNGVYQWKPDAERHTETYPDLWADTAQC